RRRPARGGAPADVRRFDESTHAAGGDVPIERVRNSAGAGLLDRSVVAVYRSRSEGEDAEGGAAGGGEGRSEWSGAGGAEARFAGVVEGPVRRIVKNGVRVVGDW